MGNDLSPTEATMKLLEGSGFSPSQISLAVSATVSLTGMNNQKANVPLALIQKWEGLLNQIRVGRTA